MNARNRKGQGIIEMLVGSIVFIVPMSLFALDLGTVLVANSANDHLVSNAARAAADQDCKDKAQSAVQKCIGKFPKSNIVVDVKLAGDIDYSDDQQVVVTTVMKVKLPVGVAGMDTVEFKARAVQPIVAKPSNV